MARWRAKKQMKRWYPEHVFAALILVGMATGVALQVTGISPYWGIRIAIGVFAVAWLPALLVIVLIVIPRWWRGR